MEYHDLNLHWVWDFKNEAIQWLRQKGFQVKNFIWKDRWIIIITTQNFNHCPTWRKDHQRNTCAWKMKHEWRSAFKSPLELLICTCHIVCFLFPFGFPIKSQHRLEISSLSDVFKNISTSAIREFFLASNLIPIYCLVHPKGDQSWGFIGRTDAEAETQILWPPHAKSWLIGKDPDAGRDWG